MKNYMILHKNHGLKIEGIVLEPKYLCSLNQNMLVDLYLSNNSINANYQ